MLPAILVQTRSTGVPENRDEREIYGKESVRIWAPIQNIPPPVFGYHTVLFARASSNDLQASSYRNISDWFP